jgi:hypothetical protein
MLNGKSQSAVRFNFATALSQSSLQLRALGDEPGHLSSF